MKYLLSFSILIFTLVASFAQSNDLAFQAPSLVSYTLADDDSRKTVMKQDALQAIKNHVTKNMKFSSEFEYVNKFRLVAAVAINKNGQIKDVAVLESDIKNMNEGLIDTIKDIKTDERFAADKDYTVVIPFVFKK